LFGRYAWFSAAMREHFVNAPARVIVLLDPRREEGGGGDRRACPGVGVGGGLTTAAAA
jgi:hypothetical protein